MSTSARRQWAIGLGVVLLGLGAGAWFWLRPAVPRPPEPDLTHADPEIAAAVQAARAELEKAPRSGDKWGRYGMVLRVHHFVPESNLCFAEAAHLDPHDPRWPYLHGLTVVLDDPPEGIRLIRKGVELCHDRPLAPRLRLAEALIDQGRLDEAEEHLHQAARLDPGNPRTALGQARLELERGRWREAVGLLDTCVDDPHARKKAYQLRAQAWYRLGEPERARDDQRKGAEKPEDVGWPDPFVREVALLQVGVQARMNRADDAFVSGQLDEAFREMEQLVKDRPESAEAWLLLGRRLVGVGRYPAAESVLEQHAVRLAPDKVDAWFQLGIARMGQQKWGEAADCFRRVLRLKPDHAPAHFDLGQCHRHLGDRAAALEEYRQALLCQPDMPEALLAQRELSDAGSQSP
jgi:tetratricopeptide (TPR) repeat protein